MSTHFSKSNPSRWNLKIKNILSSNITQLLFHHHLRLTHAPPLEPLNPFPTITPKSPIPHHKTFNLTQPSNPPHSYTTINLLNFLPLPPETKKSPKWPQTRIYGGLKPCMTQHSTLTRDSYKTAWDECLSRWSHTTVYVLVSIVQW